MDASSYNQIWKYVKKGREILVDSDNITFQLALYFLM